MDGVLDRQYYHAIKEAQRRLHDLLPVFDSANACGMDCADLRDAHTDFSAKLTAIEQRFFPNGAK